METTENETLNAKLRNMVQPIVTLLDVLDEVKGKNLTNTRSSSKDHTVVLKRPRQMSLEYCLDYINSDELVEVTPVSFRLRKKILNTAERKKYNFNKKNA